MTKRKSNRRSGKLTTLAVVPVVLAVGTWVALPPPTVIDYEAEFALIEQQVLADLAALQAQLAHLNAYGMEAQAAGLHIIEPPAFVGMSGEEIIESSSFTGHSASDWDWWPLRTVYLETVCSDPVYAINSVHVSIQRLAPNAAIELSKVVTSGGWGINVTFDQRTLDYLSQVHGPVSSSIAFTDWNGVVHSNGGAASNMTATIVSENVAYWPFDVSGILSQVAPVTVMVAKDLTEVTVDKILELFEQG